MVVTQRIKSFFRNYYDYLLIVILFFIIFFRNLTDPLLVDYLPSSSGLSKILFLNSFNGGWLPFELLRIILSITSLLMFIFSISILISFILSYYFIKKLFSKYSLLVAFIFFFNPFIYSRIMVGQIGVVIVYCLFPASIYYILNLFKNSFQKKDLFLSAIIITIMASFQSQSLAFNLLLFIIASIFYFKKSNIKKYLLFSLMLFIFLVFLNVFWLQGFFSSDNSIFQSIDSSHESFFAPKLTEGVPAIAKIIGMWGFWRENGYITTYKTLPLPLWYSLTFMFVALMLIGYYTTNKEKISKFFYSLWWIGLIFATGISHPYTAPIFDFFFNHVPFFNGFRDSHKFVVFICLAYAYLCPIGIMWIKEKVEGLAGKLEARFIHRKA